MSEKQDPRDKKSTKAGGFPAIFSTFEKSFKEMGLLRSLSALTNANQKKGFDCPGCAWPDPEEKRSMTEFCENGAKAIADEATRKSVDANFFRNHSIEDLRNVSRIELNSYGRLAVPVYAKADDSHFQETSWEFFFERCAAKLKSLKDPNRAAFYTSGRTSNEAAFLYQLLCRGVGTNNMPDCSNLCHESSGIALKETIGIGKGTVKLDDFSKAGLILVVGQNPGSNHPRMLSALQDAKRSGAKIVSINPLDEVGSTRFIHPQEVHKLLGKGTLLRDLHIPLPINRDFVLFRWLNAKLLNAFDNGDSSAIDFPFIESHTQSFDAYKRSLDKLDLNQLEEQVGIDTQLLEQLLTLVLKESKIIVCWAMGLTQHQNAVATIQEIAHFNLLKGAIGKAGAGLCPVRGHSNVQGDRTMGIWEAPSEAFLQSLESGMELQAPLPRDHGFSAVDALRAMENGEVDFLFSMGGNLVDAMPDTNRCADAITKVDFVVHASTKLNRSHLSIGEETFILPVRGRTDTDLQKSGEQFVTVENSMGYVHKSRGVFSPPSHHCRSEVSIVCELAKQIGVFPHINWLGMKEDYRLIREHISKSIEGFENFNLRLEQEEGFYLPNAPRDLREFATSNGRAQFVVNELSFADAQDEFLMMTIRTHDQFNTTVYSSNDRYRGVFGGRKVVLMSDHDMKRLHLEVGCFVDVSSHYESKERVLNKFQVLPYDLPRNCLAMYFPEANPLIPLEQYADRSKTPISKSIRVRVQKSR